MSYYDRVDVSEIINVTKTSTLKEFGICHDWYFLNLVF